MYAGVRGVEIEGKFTKYTAIGVYLEDCAIPSLAPKWKGKTAEELMDSVEFFRDIVTGNGKWYILKCCCNSLLIALSLFFFHIGKKKLLGCFFVISYIMITFRSFREVHKGDNDLAANGSAIRGEGGRKLHCLLERSW